MIKTGFPAEGSRHPAARVAAKAPYVGARPFDTADEHIFCGRDTEIEELAGRWRRHRLTILYGTSGVGKTSLLRAGVLPALKRKDLQVLPLGVLRCRPTFPLAMLPRLNPHTFAVLSSWFPAESPGRLAALPVVATLRGGSRTDDFGRTQPVHAAIDQAELLACTFGAHTALGPGILDELAEAGTTWPHLRLLISVREDHLDEILPVAERLFGTDFVSYELGPLGRNAALAAVRDPLGGGSPHALHRAAELIFDELRTFRESTQLRYKTPAVDPALLQVVCERLWHGESAAWSTGDLADEIDRILREFCARTLATVATEHRLSPDAVNSWFREVFVDRSDGVSVESSASDRTPAILRALQDQHIVRTCVRSGIRRAEIQHPRLAMALQAHGDLPPTAPVPTGSSRLDAAEQALANGDFEFARHHVADAAGACAAGDLRCLGVAERMYGDIAYCAGEPDLAADHYRAAAGLFEALGDTVAVALLLAATGRMSVGVSPVQALRVLQAAAERLPNDLAVQTGLGQALWQTGSTRAALAVLNAVLAYEGNAPEALRTRGEILADLGQIEPALRDLRRIDHKAWPSTKSAWALAQAMGRRLSVDERDLDRTVTDAADNGPVLLRVARVKRFGGNTVAAAALAGRAVAAEHPPLPPQLHILANQLASNTGVEEHPISQQD